MHARRFALALAAAALTLTACGADTPSVGGPSSAAPRPTEPGTGEHPTDPPPATDGGWLGGAPAWHAPEDAGAGRELSATATEAPSGDMTLTEAPTAAMPGDIAPPGDIVAQPGLRAGSVDDNADFTGYLDYLTRIADLGIALRPFDPTGRIVVSVRGADGRPVAGAEVHIAPDDTPSADSTAVVLRTTADGTVRYHPALYGVPAASYEVWIEGGPATTAEPDGTAELVLDGPGGRAAPVAVDVLFLLDATGSMGDEIDRLKTQIDSVAERVAALEGAPDVRFGMTLYRDEGDAFVTATRDFTSDVQAFRADLADVVADGGGDYPEALEEGLAEALLAPAWRDPASTLQLVFLVADAPPQVGRQLDHTYADSIREAVGRGLKIFPVASSESDDQAEAVFRQLAQATGARFVFLTYGAGGAATGGNTDITSTDYEELALDDLVVRLVAEELAELTGDASVVPPVTAPPPVTTNPPGQ